MLVEKDLQIAELKKKIQLPPQQQSEDCDLNELLEENERLKIENIHLRKNYEREKSLVD